MGHQIVYCGRCGSGIRHDEFGRGRAVMVEMIAYCRGCVPADTPRELPAATPRRATAAPRAESSTRLSPGTGRRPRPGIGSGPWIAGATAAVVVLGGLAFFASGPSQPAPAGEAPSARPPRPVSAPVVASTAPDPALEELLALERAGGDPDALLLRCDQARVRLKGTPAEKTLGEIERRAAAEKVRRDRERQFETALRNVMELMAQRSAPEREKEVFALLAAAAEIAGPRRGEVDALEARYRELLKKAAATAAETPAPAPAPPPAAAPAPGTLLFQDGVYPSPDYRGTSDVTLFESAPDKPKGGSPGLDVDGDNPSRSDKDSLALLRWDLSSVPPGTRIASADIVFRAQDKSRSTYHVYPLARAWSEAEATWNVASAGQPWEVPGARGAADRRATSVGRLSPNAGTVRVPLDAALVQEWIDRPAANHGLALDNPKSSDGVVLRSREWTVPAERPMLQLVLAEGPARVLFSAGIAGGFAKMENGTVTPEGLLIPPGGSFTSWRAFSAVVGPRTRLRFRVKSLFDVQEAYVISWCEARKQNARWTLRGLQKDTWTDFDLPVAEFRFGFKPSDPRFEGEVIEGFRIHFTGAPDARFLLERVEVVEAGG